MLILLYLTKRRSIMNKLKLLIPVILLMVVGFVFSAKAETVDTMTVYVDQANGEDTNDGLTEATAVKTLDAAYVLLNNGLSGTGTGTIVLVSDYTHTLAAEKDFIATSVTSHSYMVHLQGKTADVKFILKNSAQSYFNLLGPTTIEQLCIYTTGSNKYVSIHGAGVNGKLVIGEGVTGGDNADYYVSLAAVPNTGGDDEANADKSIYMEVNSGNWKSIYATSYTNNCRGNATCVINGGTVNKLSVRYSNTFTGNVRFELNGGTINEFCPIGANAKAIVTGDITVVRAGADINKTTTQGTHNGTLTDEEAPVVVSGTVVLTVTNSAFNVVLYSGISGSNEITPTKTVTEDGITKYYFEDLAAGTYHSQVSRNGYYTIKKAHYFTSEQMATETVLDVSSQQRVLSGSSPAKYQPTAYQEFTDAMMAMLNNKENAAWYQNYAQYLTTPVFAEGKKHQQTTQEEMEAYIADLDDANDHMYVYSIGESAEGKNIPIVIFSLTDLSDAETLEDAAALINANEKLTAHYQAQIHGNEPAGGEAALATIGRLDTAYGDRLLEKMNIYVIPRLNPDGSEDYVRIVPSDKLNGNRDMLMAKTLEVQAHHYAYNLFMPELAIDGHEYTVDNTNNNQAYKDMMMAGGYNGNSGEAFAQFTEDLILQTGAYLKTKGLDYSFYTNIANNNYSVSGTMYAGLRGSVSFLLESRGIGFGNHTMDRRVISHLIALESIFEYAYQNTDAIQAASDAERQRIVNNGKTYEDTDVLAVSHVKISDERLSHVTDKYNYLTGEKTGTIDVTPVKYVADTTRVRPTAYVIPAGQDWTQNVLDMFDLHAITYYYVEAGTAINLQQYFGTTEGITLGNEQAVVFGKGAYVATMNQSSALILTSLMEPDLQDEYFEETNSGVKAVYGNLAQLGVIPAYGESFPIYRYCHDLNAEGKVDTTEAPKVEYKVYIHSAEGLDTNDAYTESTAAATIEHAFDQLNILMTLAPEGTEGTEGTVVFLDLYELGTGSFTFPSHDYPVVMTSKTGAEGLTKAYLKDNGWFAFSGDVTLDNITIQPSGGNDYYYIFANGHNLTVKETVNTAASPYGKYFTIAGGAYSNGNYSEGATSVNASPNLTILGGTWKYVYASSYTGKLIGNPNLTIENAIVLGIMPSYAAVTQGHVYITLKNTQVSDGVIYMGNAYKNNLSYCTLTLGTGVDVDTIYTGSRDAGNVSKNATIIVDGADMTGIQIIRGAKNETGTVGKNVFVYKSGTVGPIVGYDEVQVYVDGQFHSLTAAMTKLSLKPSVTGFGYKAEFTADETIQSMIVGQGYSLWMHEDVVISRTVSDFRDALTLRLQNFDIENYGSTKVNAKVFAKLSNGLVIETETVSYSMQDMVELIDANITNFSDEQIQAVKTMLAGYTAPSNWSIPNLKPEE